MQRIPRPKGLTQLAINYNATNEDQIYKKMIKLIMTEYVNNQFTLNNVPQSLEQISTNYNIPIELIQKEINEKATHQASFLNTKDLLSTHKELLDMVMGFTIFDRGHIARQLNLLLSSQGATYKPFVTGEVNNVLKLLLSSTKNLLDLSDKLVPKNNDIVALLLQGSQAEALTSTEATEMIRNMANENRVNKALPPSQATLLQSRLPDVYHLNDLENMPEVRANHTDEAANINVKAKKLLEDPMAQLPPKDLSDKFDDLD